MARHQYATSWVTLYTSQLWGALELLQCTRSLSTGAAWWRAQAAGSQLAYKVKAKAGCSPSYIVHMNKVFLPVAAGGL